MDQKVLISSLTGIILGVLAYFSIQSVQADCAVPYLSLQIESIHRNSIQHDVETSNWPIDAELDAYFASFHAFPQTNSFCFGTEDLWKE